MSEFNPYHQWLKIPPDEQPPTPHRLLEVALDETDKEIIREATLKKNKFIRQFSLGEHGKIAERLLNEISAAQNNIIAGKVQTVIETPSFMATMKDEKFGLQPPIELADEWYQSSEIELDSIAAETPIEPDDKDSEPSPTEMSAEKLYELGEMYCFGQGVTQDYTEAVKWSRLAAEQGDAAARHNLGTMYF